MGKQWNMELYQWVQYCHHPFEHPSTHPGIQPKCLDQTDCPFRSSYTNSTIFIFAQFIHIKKNYRCSIFWYFELTSKWLRQTLGHIVEDLRLQNFQLHLRCRFFFPLKELIIWWLVWTLHCKSSCMKLLPHLFEKHCFSTLNEITISWNQYHSICYREHFCAHLKKKYFF